MLITTLRKIADRLSFVLLHAEFSRYDCIGRSHNRFARSSPTRQCNSAAHSTASAPWPITLVAEFSSQMNPLPNRLPLGMVGSGWLIDRHISEAPQAEALVCESSVFFAALLVD